MKQKDIFLIVVIGIFSAVVSMIISNQFISSDTNKSLTAEVVEPISTEFIQPPQAYFNQNSVNPTQLIRIDPNTTGNPFGQ